ncbi:MAG: glycosyltransferase [Deltaproteobacteria bacterium]|nr:glycosyltransferase [Deltaproteobacteria bacterium]
MPTLSVGVMAHNEDKNIGGLLRAVLNQRLESGYISEILVVASGCTDRTVEIVEALSREDHRIELVVQPRRAGKASAVNEFLKRATGDIQVLVSADVLPAADAFEKLILPFQDPRVGMTGGRPVPLNALQGAVNHAVHLQWRLHHRMASIRPKLGEVVAFVSKVSSIPETTWVDEVALEYHFLSNGYTLVYAPEAIIWNHGPTSIRDFLRQRRRIHSGHLDFYRKTGYRVATFDVRTIFHAFLQEFSAFPASSRLFLVLAVLLEAWGRALGRLDMTGFPSSHVVWKRSATTKECLDELSRT